MKKKFFIIVMVSMLIFVFAGCGSSDSSTNLKEGQEITLTDDNYVSTSKDIDSELNSYISNKNQDGINTMITNGEVFIITKGTKVSIADLGVGLTKIQVEDGDYKGQEGYIPTDLIK